VNKFVISAVAGALSIAVAGPALASDVAVTDPAGDVVRDYYGYTEVGSFDGDITAATVSYTDGQVRVVTQFSDLDALSVNQYFVSLDVNGDLYQDYILGFMPSGSAVVDARTSVAVGTPTVAFAYGVPGSVTASFPASIIGNPATLTAQILAGYRFSDGTFGNADGIPQDSAGALSWTPAVTNTATVPAVAAPPAAAPPTAAPISSVTVVKAVKPKVSAKLSSHSQSFKSKKRVKVTFSIAGVSKASGRVKVYDGKRKIGTVTVRKGKAVFSLPSKLKPGTHKIKAIYVPNDRNAYKLADSKVYKVKVKR
jgi:hypothetical protein